MGRPPVEWPIPAYTVELRERVVAVFTVPAAALARHIVTPVAAVASHGRAVVALCLSGGRCLKPEGGVPTLASEFRLAELVAPAEWRPACQPVVRGLYLLRLVTDAAGLRRLVRTALEFEPEPAVPPQREGWGTPGWDGGEVRLAHRSPSVEWPASSIFPSVEAAEARLMHPECYFVPSRYGDAVRAVPVHQYARRTAPVGAPLRAAPFVASALGIPPAEVIVDHLLVQKRCTHVWSFPPERIPAASGGPYRRALSVQR